MSNDNDGFTLGQAVAFLRKRLSEGFPAGETDALVKIIFYRLMGYETVDLILRKDSELPGFMRGKLDRISGELLDKRPVQYVFGKADFHGHTFRVDESTLIPRPETEELVDMVADDCRGLSDLTVLDAGTGSGCIAVSLALALRFPEVWAIDISEAALKVAEENARSLHAKVRFFRADMLNLPKDVCRWNVIVSNPPYIAMSEKASMDRNVTDYEPSGALFVSDADPLVFYRALAKYGADALKPGGRLYFEINSRFPEKMRAMLLGMGYEDVELRRDMQGLYRFASACRRK